MCIEPPLPPQMPSCLPKISAIIAVHVAALGDAVAVAAMGAGDVVVGRAVHADADGDRLLAGVEMHEARDVAGRELAVHALLELADRAHHPVGLEQLLLGELARPGGAAADMTLLLRRGRADPSLSTLQLRCGRGRAAARITASTSMRQRARGSSTVTGRPAALELALAVERDRARRRAPASTTSPSSSTRCRRRRPASTRPGRAAPAASLRPRRAARAARAGRAAPRRRLELPGHRRQPDRAGLAKRDEQLGDVPRRQTARAPTKRSALTATSTSARSARPPRSTRSARLAPRRCRRRRPVATRPTASPATVVSRSSGKALLVPVESAHSGISPHAGHDAVRAVAAEHDDRRDAAPRTSRATASTVSCARAVGSIVELLELRERRAASVARGCAAGGAARRDAVGGGHHQHPLDSGAARGRPSAGRPSRPSRRCRTRTPPPPVAGCRARTRGWR